MPWSISQHWPELVATLAEQSVNVSHLVMRGLEFLQGTGRLRKNEADVLNAALNSLRETSVKAQQITRLASGRIRQPRNRVDLEQAVRDMLFQRDAALHDAAVNIRSDTQPTEVWLDPPVAATLLENALDWAMSFSHDIVLKLDAGPDPYALLQLTMRTDGSMAQQNSRQRNGRRFNDGLHWMLLRQLVDSANLQISRTENAGVVTLQIRFPNTYTTGLDGVSSVDIFEDADSTGHALANAWILVIAEDPSLRTATAQTLALTGLPSKVARNLDEARVALTESWPNAVVVDNLALRDRAAWDELEPLLVQCQCPVIEILESATSFQQTGFDGYQRTKVNRAELRQQLGPAVLFEIAKNY